MSSFTTPLIVRHLDGLKWAVVEPFSYHVGDEDSTEVINVPAEFITDFASIPCPFWSVIGHPTGRYGKAAVIHDYLYFTQEYPRKRADFIFYEAMKVLGVPFWKRWLMYHAVRTFGWMAWKRKRRVA